MTLLTLGLYGTFVSETLADRAVNVVRSHDLSLGPLAVFDALRLPHSPRETKVEFPTKFVENASRQHYDAMVALAGATVGNHDESKEATISRGVCTWQTSMPSCASLWGRTRATDTQRNWGCQQWTACQRGATLRGGTAHYHATRCQRAPSS